MDTHWRRLPARGRQRGGRTDGGRPIATVLAGNRRVRLVPRRDPPGFSYHGPGRSVIRACSGGDDGTPDLSRRAGRPRPLSDMVARRRLYLFRKRRAPGGGLGHLATAAIRRGTGASVVS